LAALKSRFFVRRGGSGRKTQAVSRKWKAEGGKRILFILAPQF